MINRLGVRGRLLLAFFGISAFAVLAAIAAVNAVVAFFYYAKVVKSVWMDPVPETVAVDDTPASDPVPSLVLALGISVIAVLVIGVFPQLFAFFGEATEALLAAP